MRASIIWVPHSGHSGHTIRVVGRGGVSTGNPLISAALEKISHRAGKETVQYCSHAAPRDTRGNATPSAELILILAHLLHGNSIAALGRRRHRATGGKTPICVGCHTAVKGAVLIYRGSGRKSEAPAPAAQQGKTAGRAELSHQKSV
jgi:hypothetical protein